MKLRLPLVSSALTAAIVSGSIGYVAMTHPDTPLPAGWNPAVPLQVSHKPSPITGWKLRRAAKSLSTCVAAMDDVSIEVRPPLRESDRCGIDERVRVSAVGQSQLVPIDTSCAIVLRLAMWERHALQPAAIRHLGSNLKRIRHFSSYSCRPIRTLDGNGNRMSTHATGEAIDIAGFDFSDGRRVTLLAHWNGTPDDQAFLREARDGACRWFATTLGPDYNSLHADHFHLQSRGWGLCK